MGTYCSIDFPSSVLYTGNQEMGFVTEYGLRTGKGCSFLFLLQIDKELYGEYFSMDIQAKREKEKED